MTKTIWIFLALPGLLLAADKATQVTAGEPSSAARKVAYRNGDSVRVFGQYGWESIAVLPSAEKILDVFCGNEDAWTVHVRPKTNFVAFTPNRPGVPRSNVMLVAASGNIYTFELVDVSKDASGHADTQVLLNVTDDGMRNAMKAAPKYVSAEDVEAFKTMAARAEEEASKAREQAQATAQAEADKLRAELPSKIRTDYEYDRSRAEKAPWNLKGLFHDDKFSYFRSSSQEALAVYEIKDGKPVAVNMFPTGEGIVRLDRIVDRGYFQLGSSKKNRLAFELKGE